MILAALFSPHHANHSSHVVFLVPTWSHFHLIAAIVIGFLVFRFFFSVLQTLYGREQALPLRAHHPGAGAGSTGSLLDGCGGTSGVCHFLYNGGADGEHWDSLERVPVLPTGEEKNSHVAMCVLC